MMVSTWMTLVMEQIANQDSIVIPDNKIRFSDADVLELRVNHKSTSSV